MAREINKLSDRFVRSNLAKGRYSDGGGLYLQVGPTGAKSWLFRYQRQGKSRQMGLGAAITTISLAEARQKATTCRRLLDQGLDPIDERKAERSRVQAETAKFMTFKECADELIRDRSAVWSNLKHSKQWKSTLEKYVYPFFGDLAVQDVDVGLVVKALRPIALEKPETARRVRGRIEAVLDWAAAHEYREGANPARWKGHLDHLLPAMKSADVNHMAALPYDQINEFLQALKKQQGVATLGLQFLILTAARTNEVIGAKWSEISLEDKIWTIPAKRMKAGKTHVVPLSDAALAILREIKELEQSDFVFPGGRPKSPLSNMAFLAVLKRMKRQDITVHGFRSTFKDWAAETTAYPNEVSEMALAHSIGSKVESAYRRGNLFEKRQHLMRDWAKFCIEPQSGASSKKIIPIRRKK